MGHPYSGVAYDALAAKCLWKETAYGFGVDVAAFASVFLVIDGAFSLVADTVFLPIDLAVTPGHERVTANKICTESLGP